MSSHQQPVATRKANHQTNFIKTFLPYGMFITCSFYWLIKPADPLIFADHPLAKFNIKQPLDSYFMIVRLIQIQHLELEN